MEKIIRTNSAVTALNAEFKRGTFFACGTEDGVIRVYDISSEAIISSVKASVSVIAQIILIQSMYDSGGGDDFLLLAASVDDDDLICYAKKTNQTDVFSTMGKLQVGSDHHNITSISLIGGESAMSCCW